MHDDDVCIVALHCIFNYTLDGRGLARKELSVGYTLFKLECKLECSLKMATTSTIMLLDQHTTFALGDVVSSTLGDDCRLK